MINEKSVFDFEHYLEFLNFVFDKDRAPRGLRRDLAVALRCQPAFISRVLSGLADFSQEHLLVISQFLKLSEDEGNFLMFLLLRDRSATPALKAHYSKQIAAIHEKRLVIANRIQVKDALSKTDQATYYSSWTYAAVHIALLNPKLRHKQALSIALGLSIDQLNLILDFLSQTGLVTVKSGEYFPSQKRVHIKKDAPHYVQHMTNWNLRAIMAVQEKRDSHVHYGGPFSVSHALAQKMKDDLVNLLEKWEPEIRDAKDEQEIGLVINLFSIAE